MSVAGVYGTTGFIRVNGNPLEPHANTQLPNNVGAPGADGNGSAGNGTSKSNASGTHYDYRHTGQDDKTIFGHLKANGCLFCITCIILLSSTS